jgi:hypothetical protein
MVPRDAFTGSSMLIARLPQSQQTVWNSKSLSIEKTSVVLIIVYFTSSQPLIAAV